MLQNQILSAWMVFFHAWLLARLRLNRLICCWVLLKKINKSKTQCFVCLVSVHFSLYWLGKWISAAKESIQPDKSTRLSKSKLHVNGGGKQKPQLCARLGARYHLLGIIVQQWRRLPGAQPANPSKNPQRRNKNEWGRFTLKEIFTCGSRNVWITARW